MGCGTPFVIIAMIRPGISMEGIADLQKHGRLSAPEKAANFSHVIAVVSTPMTPTDNFGGSDIRKCDYFVSYPCRLCSQF
jgi:hypothetical protein